MPTITDRLTEVARQHLYIDTLEQRRSDALDFHTVSVWGLKDALRAAYEVGLEHARQPREAILLDALEQVQDQMQDIFSAEDLGTPYTRAEILTWLDELREMASKIIAEANGLDHG